MNTRFDTVLVANRGEIACRIIRSVHALGLRAVAVYASADSESAHVRDADVAVHLGATPAESYLNIDAIIQACKDTGAQAIHPGYGFLSENVTFARACAEAGITFIGPGEKSLEVMGDKITSKNHVAAAGVPVVQGISEPGLSDEQLIEAAETMTYPVLIKPSAGGGGKGMHVVEKFEDLPETLVTARRVAKNSFGDDTLFIEQLIRSPRHIEVQILADAHGSVIHLGERECSLQRRHQKVIEEAPSALLSPETRARIGQAAVDTAASVDYVGAGTVEFLVSDLDPDTFYFMEMNTRLQVEHPVTEEVTGIDLVEEQLRIAAGEPLRWTQDDVSLTGHSIEARVYAEVPESGFLPSTGEVLALGQPTGPGVRVDSGLRVGSVISPQFDPMLAKVIATGSTREEALNRLDRALGGTVVLGVETNISYLRQLINDPDVRAAQMDTTMIERKLPELEFARPDELTVQAAAHTLSKRNRVHRIGEPGARGWQMDGFRLSASATPPRYLVHFSVPGADVATTHEVELDPAIRIQPADESGQRYELHGPTGSISFTFAVEEVTTTGTRVWIHTPTFSGQLIVADRSAQTWATIASLEAESLQAAPEITAPLPGTVISVAVSSGDEVEAGDTLVVIEAMKMEHKLSAPFSGTAQISVREGQQISLGTVVAAVTPPDDDTESDPGSDS